MFSGFADHFLLDNPRMQDGNYESCPGGAERHYDQSLWLTDGFEGGAGGDWGQRIGREYFMELLGSHNIHILLHELVSLSFRHSLGTQYANT